MVHCQQVCRLVISHSAGTLAPHIPHTLRGMLPQTKAHVHTHVSGSAGSPAPWAGASTMLSLRS